VCQDKSCAHGQLVSVIFLLDAKRSIRIIMSWDKCGGKCRKVHIQKYGNLFKRFEILAFLSQYIFSLILFVVKIKKNFLLWIWRTILKVLDS
jgi:hypothetical protein